jgi:hypothetical protein
MREEEERREGRREEEVSSDDSEEIFKFIVLVGEEEEGRGRRKEKEEGGTRREEEEGHTFETLGLSIMILLKISDQLLDPFIELRRSLESIGVRIAHGSNPFGRNLKSFRS